MDGYTNFTNVHGEIVNADLLVGPLTGNASTASIASCLTGHVVSTNVLSKAANYSLSTAEIGKLFTNITMTTASKVLTLGLVAGQMMIVYNAGAETVKVKNVAGDTGTDVATTKAILVIGSLTADASIVIALN